MKEVFVLVSGIDLPFTFPTSLPRGGGKHPVKPAARAPPLAVGGSLEVTRPLRGREHVTIR